MCVRMRRDRNFLKSQCSSFSTADAHFCQWIYWVWCEGHIPSATPQRYSLPLTVRPSAVWTSSVLPMIENGIAAYTSLVSTTPAH